MSVQIEMLEKNMARLTIDVPADEFSKAITKAYNKNKGQIMVPGFRKGKVPQTMVERMYGADIFYEEAANDVMPGAYETAAQESNLQIVSRPSIDVVQMEKGKDFIFTADVALKPDVTLGDYMGVEVSRTIVEVTDEEVEADLKKTQEMNAREVTVERPAQEGDIVVLDYSGTVDGEAFDGGSAEEYSLELGSDTFIPGFEEQLIGVEADTDKDVCVTFPEEYHAQELAGREAVFACHIHAVKTKEYPPIDDEFAQDVSEFDTLEEYRNDVRGQLLQKKEEEARSQKQQKVMDQIIANAQIDIPDAMVQTQAEGMVDEYAQRLSYQGISIEQYYQFTGLDNQKLAEQLKPQALKNIQSRLVLEAIAAAENVEVTDADVDAEIERLASSYQMETDKVRELMGESELDSMRKDLAADKALNLVTDAAVEVEINIDEEEADEAAAAEGTTQEETASAEEE